MAEMEIREALRRAMTEEMEKDESIFLMGEEVGELFKAIRKHQKYSNEGEPSNEETSKIKVGEELVDVLNYILALANRLDIDMEDAFRRKNLINQTRSWSTTNST